MGTFVENAGWYRPMYVPAPVRDSIYRGPSWSWLSLHCAIEVKAVEIPDAKVLRASTKPVHVSTPHGRLESGTVTLQGPVLRAVDVSADVVRHWSFFFDYEKIGHIEDESIYLLSLGKQKSKDYQDCAKQIALVLTQEETASFSRIGLVWYCQGEVWDSATTRELVIV